MQDAHGPETVSASPILVEDKAPKAEVKAEPVVAAPPPPPAPAGGGKPDPVLATDEDSQSSFTAGSGLQPSLPSTSSGRVSAGSSIDDSKRGSTEGIKCALCTETFADSAALQAHTLINHTSEHLKVKIKSRVILDA